MKMTAASLADIADNFAARAEDARKRADASTAAKLRYGWQVEAETWEAAARALRETEIVAEAAE